jgi:hypothetical protein
MKWPPWKETGALQHAPISEKLGCAQYKSARVFAQVCPHSATLTQPLPQGHLPTLARQQCNAFALAGIIGSREQILREIRSLRVTQAPFGRIFWSLEQRIARLTDEIERRSS